MRIAPSHFKISLKGADRLQLNQADLNPIQNDVSCPVPLNHHRMEKTIPEVKSGRRISVHIMKDRFSVTISNTAGSRHFFVDSNRVRNSVIGALAVVITVTASFSLNYFQIRNNGILADATEKLDHELMRFDSLNSNLNQNVLNLRQKITSISSELVEIERLSGIESHDVELSLDERIQLVGIFYNAREEEYSEIGSRVEQIEDVIGLERFVDNDIDLAARVELASLTASQERILHDSVPSGFPAKSRVVTSKFGKRTHPLTKVKSLRP